MLKKSVGLVSSYYWVIVLFIIIIIFPWKFLSTPKK